MSLNPLRVLRDWWRAHAKAEVAAGIEEGIREGVAEALSRLGQEAAPADPSPIPAAEDGQRKKLGGRSR
jgi:hypothetical protein